MMKNNRSFTPLAVAAALLALGASCSAAMGAETADAMFGRSGGSPLAMKAVAPEAAPAEAVPENAGRKLTYRADMTVEVDDLEAAEAAALEAVRAAGGYAAVRQADEGSAYLELRVPVASLEPLMDRFAGAGKTRSRSVSAEDVTDYYFDLEGRLRNKRILEERYRDYLRKAQSVEDMLAVEARLSETTNDIERLEGAFRDLGDRIDLATLSLSLRAAKAADPSRPTLGESLGRLFAGLADAFRLAVVALVGLVVYGVPAILAIAAMWWLAFGRVGLVRRLFSLARSGGARKTGGA
jgi:hypothetical protein